VAGFLRPTLNKCFGVLETGGTLIWNVADFKIDGVTYRLERDSIMIIRELFGNVLRLDYVMHRIFQPTEKSEAILIAKK